MLLHIQVKRQEEEDTSCALTLHLKHKNLDEVLTRVKSTSESEWKNGVKLCAEQKVCA